MATLRGWRLGKSTLHWSSHQIWIADSARLSSAILLALFWHATKNVGGLSGSILIWLIDSMSLPALTQGDGRSYPDLLGDFYVNMLFQKVLSQCWSHIIVRYGWLQKQLPSHGNSSSIATCSKLLDPPPAPMIFSQVCSPTGLPDQKGRVSGGFARCESESPVAVLLGYVFFWRFGRLRLKPTDSMIHFSHFQPTALDRNGVSNLKVLGSIRFLTWIQRFPLLRSQLGRPKSRPSHPLGRRHVALSSLERWRWPPRDGPDGRGPR